MFSLLHEVVISDDSKKAHFAKVQRKHFFFTLTVLVIRLLVGTGSLGRDVSGKRSSYVA